MTHDLTPTEALARAACWPNEPGSVDLEDGQAMIRILRDLGYELRPIEQRVAAETAEGRVAKPSPANSAAVAPLDVCVALLPAPCGRTHDDPIHWRGLGHAYLAAATKEGSG